MEFIEGVREKAVTEIRQILSGGCEGREVRVNGAVHTIRSMGEVAFVVLRKAGGLCSAYTRRGLPILISET